MKQLILLNSLYFLGLINAVAQRPATAAETAEDARVLQTISAAMPHEVADWLDEGESSYGINNITGITGFYNNTNFATRDVFEHQYTISYRMIKADDEMKKELEAAQAKNDFTYIEGITRCQINIYVNYCSAPFTAATAFKKTAAVFSPLTYKDEAGREYMVLYFGKNWQVTPSMFVNDDGYGKIEKEYSLKSVVKNNIGTAVQSIMVVIKANEKVADMFAKKINWNKINSLIGTGNVKDDLSETELKKYFTEKAVTPVPGNNSLSFTYTDKDGKEQYFSLNSSTHDLSNCAILRNHNENPKVLQDAHIDFRIKDGKDGNRLFYISLPIIRTTGTVTATYQSDYNYQIMWRGNTDITHSFTATDIEINLTKWAAVGDFIEGTFSGTATIHDHNSLSTEQPAYTIKNGKFRIRRIADEMK